MCRKKYEKLRRQCRRLLRQCDKSFGGKFIQDMYSPSSEEVESARESLSSGEKSPLDDECLDDSSSVFLEGDDGSRRFTNADSSAFNTDSSETDSSDDAEVIQVSSPTSENREADNFKTHISEKTSSTGTGIKSSPRTTEDFTTWQRIIRVDAVRANIEWMPYSHSQATVSQTRARRSAEAVGLKDYDHLDACRYVY